VFRRLFSRRLREASSSEVERFDVLGNIRRNVFYSYGPQFSERSQAAISSDAVPRYRALLAGLQGMGYQFQTAAELVNGRGEGPNIWLRHDVDIDLETALCIAKVEASLGIVSTYYLLHTAPYFCPQPGLNPFVFSSEVREAAGKLSDLGHEVGLHNDVLLAYQTWGIDGIAHLTSALDWLRSGGVTVTGTVAHNSAPAYGADNSAIFAGRPLTPGSNSFADHPAGYPNISLGVLKESDLGLTYEGNDIGRLESFQHQYFAIRSTNLWRSPDTGKKNWLTQSQLLDELQESPQNSLITLAVHPVYFGLRATPDSSPIDEAPTLYEVDEHTRRSGIRESVQIDKENAVASALPCNDWAQFDEFGCHDLHPATWLSSQVRVVFVHTDDVPQILGVFSVAHNLQTLASCKGTQRIAASTWVSKFMEHPAASASPPTHAVIISSIVSDSDSTNRSGPVEVQSGGFNPLHKLASGSTKNFAFTLFSAQAENESYILQDHLGLIGATSLLGWSDASDALLHEAASINCRVLDWIQEESRVCQRSAD
jgi:hypothetical protein